MPPFHRLITSPVGGQSVPVLIMATKVLTDSTEIVRYLDEIAADEAKLYPTSPQHLEQVEQLEALFNFELAPAVRQWAYFYVFTQSRLVQNLWCSRVPWIERIFFPCVFLWMRSVVFQMYEINSASVLKACACIDDTFELVNHLLADGRAYLIGNRFSVADLTFATLAAPTVLPSGYSVRLPGLDELPPEMATAIQTFREKPAGRFVLRLYREHVSGFLQQGEGGEWVASAPLTEEELNQCMMLWLD